MKDITTHSRLTVMYNYILQNIATSVVIWTLQKVGAQHEEQSNIYICGVIDSFTISDFCIIRISRQRYITNVLRYSI